jgi:cytochrome c5
MTAAFARVIAPLSITSTKNAQIESNMKPSNTDAGQALHNVSRRNFLERMVRLTVTGATAPIILSALSPKAFAATQDSWRYCQKCHVMFFDGYPQKGRCAAGGGHVAQGYNFILSYDIRESGNAQAAWRSCNKCHAMFFDGYPQKGACPSGGGHVAQGYNFVLPHDVPLRGVVQAAWRYCDKCHVMFFDGYRDKGRCAAGDGHVAQGYNFVLRFQGNLENDVQLNPVEE